MHGHSISEMHFDGFFPSVSTVGTVPLDLHLLSWETHFLKNCVGLYAQYHHPWSGGVLKVKDPLAP
jgi:hypothetical protein